MKQILSKIIRFVVDAGNYQSKAVADGLLANGVRTFTDFKFRSLLATLTPAQAKSVMGMDDVLPAGYIQVNGVYYAYGSEASIYTTLSERGAERYGTYFETLLAIAMYELTAGSTHEDVSLVTMFPPGDLEHIRTYHKRLIGKRFKVRGQHGDATYSIGKVAVLDEPTAGLMTSILYPSGEQRRMDGRFMFADVQYLASLDGGGDSCDFTSASVDGTSVAIVRGSGRTSRKAGNHFLREFEQLVRQQHAKDFGNVSEVDRRLVERAFHGGHLLLGRKRIDVAPIRKHVVGLYCDEIIKLLQAGGGIGRFQAVVLTGGAMELIGDELTNRYPDVPFLHPDMLIDGDIYPVSMNNVLGAMFYARRQERLASKKKGINGR